MTSRPSVNLHIEELVLHGFEARDRREIGEALQGELTRLIVERGLPADIGRGGELERIDGGSIRLSNGSKPQATGEQIGGAVFGGFSQ